MKDKKITILFILIAIFLFIGIVGFTIAYFTSSVDFENEFSTGIYETQAVETFTSPDKWLPGDTTPKTLTVTNTGEVDVIARVCIDEKWTDSSGGTLYNEVNGERMAIINLANTSDWTKKGSCYEYNDTLEPNDTTSSFIESVTFNPNTTADLDCSITTTQNGSITKSCEHIGGWYDNATYVLTLTIETVQANKARELWPDSGMVYTVDRSSIGDGLRGLTIYNTQGKMFEANNGKLVYLKHEIESGEIIGSYVEFVVTEEMAQNNSGMTAGIYAIRGAGATYDSVNDTYNDDSPYYLTNKNNLQTAFGASNCAEDSSYYHCTIPGLSASIDLKGQVSGSQSNIQWGCHTTMDGSSRCENGLN